MHVLAPLDVLVPHRFPLVAATLLRRRDRFIADVRTADGREHMAHNEVTHLRGRVKGGLGGPGCPLFQRGCAPFR